MPDSVSDYLDTHPQLVKALVACQEKKMPLIISRLDDGSDRLIVEAGLRVGVRVFVAPLIENKAI